MKELCSCYSLINHFLIFEEKIPFAFSQLQYWGFRTWTQIKTTESEMHCTIDKDAQIIILDEGWKRIIEFAQKQKYSKLLVNINSLGVSSSGSDPMSSEA